MSVQGHLQNFFKSHSSPKRQFKKVLVACSGGPDSVALACALRDFGRGQTQIFHLAHINHHLRGKASDADEKFVRQLSRQLKWPFLCKSAPVIKHLGNLEERARVARYEGLTALAKKVRANLILTAHT